MRNLEELKIQYLERLLSKNRSTHTIKTYRIAIEDFIIYCNEKGIEIKDLDYELVEEYFYTLNHESSTMNSKIRNIRMFLNYIYKCKAGITTKFYEDIEYHKEEKKIIEYFTEKEIEEVKIKVEKLYKSHDIYFRDYVMTMFMLGTGLRVSEISNLKREDIDIDTREVRVIKGKGNKDRTLYMMKSTTDLMIEYFDDSLYFQKQPKHVFPGVRGGKFDVRHIGLLFEKITRLTGMKFHPHKLRHTFITMLVRKKIATPLISKWAGHESISTTMRYVHMSAIDIQEQSNLIDF